MRNTLKNQPTSPIPTEPSPRLLATILDRIALEIHKTARRRFAFFSTLLVVSAGGFVFAIQFLQAELASSGVLHIAALLFSDPAVALRYWQDFGLSLLELLPVASLIAALVSLFVFLESLHSTVREVKAAFHISLAS